MVNGALARWRQRFLARRRQRRSGGGRLNLDEGYNLVVLVVMITVMNIVLAKMLPLWSGVIQRDKEQEFIFRGLQYAEAIRVFQAREGRWPTHLKELGTVEPRVIRQLWDNPLAERKTREADGEGWIPVFDGQVAAPEVPEEQQADRGGLFEQREPPVEEQRGPMIGVRSKKQPEFIERDIPNWHFTARLFQARVGGEDPNKHLAVNAEDIGRLLPGQQTTSDQQQQLNNGLRNNFDPGSGRGNRGNGNRGRGQG